MRPSTPMRRSIPFLAAVALCCPAASPEVASPDEITPAVTAASDSPTSKTVRIGESLNARQPQLAIDAAGHVHLTFGADARVYYTLSTDRGESFSPPIQIAKLPSLALGMRRGPRIAVAGKTIVVTAIGGQRGGGQEGDLFAWRSDDSGRSWQGPFTINDAANSAREGLHGMAASTTGDLYCAWLDLREKGTQIFGARSTDGGVTWSKNSLVYRSPGGSVCECCHPSLVYGPTGALHVMWRNSLAGDRDLYFSTSTDNGATFSPSARLGGDRWKLDACPMDGGAIVAAPHGDIATIWRRDDQILLTADAPADEQRLGTGLQPWLAADQQKIYAVWLAKRPGDLYLATLAPPGKAPPRNAKAAPQPAPIKLASNARDPVVAAPPSGRGPLVIAWESEQNRSSIIHVRSLSAPLSR